MRCPPRSWLPDEWAEHSRRPVGGGPRSCHGIVGVPGVAAVGDVSGRRRAKWGHEDLHVDDGRPHLRWRGTAFRIADAMGPEHGCVCAQQRPGLERHFTRFDRRLTWSCLRTLRTTARCRGAGQRQPPRTSPPVGAASGDPGEHTRARKRAPCSAGLSPAHDSAISCFRRWSDSRAGP